MMTSNQLDFTFNGINRFMKNRQKKMAIRNEQKERDQQIQRINANYDHSNQNRGRR